MKSAAIDRSSSFHSISCLFFVLTVSCPFRAHAFAPPTIELGLTSPATTTNTLTYASKGHDQSFYIERTRRDILGKAFGACLVTVVPSVASASNLPDSTGADLSRTGSIDTLLPIVAIQRSLSSAKLQLSDGTSSLLATPDTCTSILQILIKSVPREEKAFKRIFDSYSTPVSYKQKFLDQNAFLVYYTKGYDGPDRKNIEEDVNSIQTLQYGLRNDAWTAMDDLYVELEFGQGSKADESALSSRGELIALVNKVLVALDSYLGLAPAADVEEATRR